MRHLFEFLKCNLILIKSQIVLTQVLNFEFKFDF